MEYIQLGHTQFGHTELHGSRLGFGTWSCGGDWGTAEAEDSRRAIRQTQGLNAGRLAVGSGISVALARSK
jgi:aryl-alcohol dehydrogenase-like predicted oxidoreductase